MPLVHCEEIKDDELTYLCILHNPHCLRQLMNDAFLWGGTLSTALTTQGYDISSATS